MTQLIISRPKKTVANGLESERTNAQACLFEALTSRQTPAQRG